jgi:head-tail adaptor
MPKGRECRVRFERPLWEKDALGTKVPAGFATVARVWGYIRPNRQQEQVQGDQPVRVVTDRIEVRWRETLAGMTSECQATVEGVIYAVVQVDELTKVDGKPSRREWLEVSVQAKPDGQAVG